MAEAGGRGRAALLADDVEFDERDAALLRTIARTGSVATAASELGRSRARALRRLEALEDAFGELVLRRRGGSDGGGSRLTDQGMALLARYDRLAVALAATADVPETVLDGRVTGVDGEIATVETAVGTILGLHGGVDTDEAVQVRIGADAVTVTRPDVGPPRDGTSARNQVRGAIAGIDRGETVFTLDVSVDGTSFRALVTADSAKKLGLQLDDTIVLTWKATATRVVETTAGNG